MSLTLGKGLSGRVLKRPYDFTALSGLTSLFYNSYAGTGSSTPGTTAWVADVGADLVTLGASPSVGAAQNGYGPADYNGTTNNLSNWTTPLSSLFGAGAGSGFELVNLRTVVADPGAGSERSGTSIYDDSGGTQFGLYCFTGYAAFCINDAGGHQPVRAALSTGAYALIQYRYNSTNIECRVNGGTWVTATCGAPANLTAIRRYGKSWINIFLDGLQLASATGNVRWDDATFTDILAGINARYSLSLA